MGTTKEKCARVTIVIPRSGSRPGRLDIPFWHNVCLWPVSVASSAPQPRRKGGQAAVSPAKEAGGSPQFRRQTPASAQTSFMGDKQREKFLKAQNHKKKKTKNKTNNNTNKKETHGQHKRETSLGSGRMFFFFFKISCIEIVV